MKRQLASCFVLSCVLAAAVACGPKDPREHLARGIALLEQKKIPEAILELRTAIQIDPSLAEARIKLVEAYTAAGNRDEAFRETIRVADLRPKDIDAQLDAARMLLVRRAFEDARARADRALTIDPKSVDALIIRGSALAGLREFDAALAEYERAIASNPGNEEGHIGIAQIKVVRGQSEQAEASFKRAIATNPKSFPARIALANFYWNAKQIPEAERELHAARELDANNPLVNRALGVVYLATNRAAEAEPYLTAMAGAAGTEGQLMLARYYQQVKRPADARRVLQAAAGTDAGFAPATTQLALMDVAEKKNKDAQGKVDAVLAKSPNYVDALVLKGQLYLGGAEARRCAHDGA